MVLSSLAFHPLGELEALDLLLKGPGSLVRLALLLSLVSGLHRGAAVVSNNVGAASIDSREVGGWCYCETPAGSLWSHDCYWSAGVLFLLFPFSYIHTPHYR